MRSETLDPGLIMGMVGNGSQLRSRLSTEKNVFKKDVKFGAVDVHINSSIINTKASTR